MSSISNSIYGSSTNKGVGGLLSGLDTDELVKQMTAATRNRINRQYQAKQKLTYKQESYREISSKLLAFSDKYFSYASGSKTNILSSKFFEANTFKSSSNYVNVTGDAEKIKNFSITSIKSVASSATLTTTKKVSNEEFSSGELGEYISPLAGDTFSIRYNNKTYNLSIDKDFNGSTFDEVVEQLNKQINSIEDRPSGLKFDVEYINADDRSQAKIKLEGGAYISAASSDVLNILKMKAGKEDGVSSSDYINESDLIKTSESILSNENSSITFDFNGVKKQINLKSDINNATKLAEHLQKELDKAYGINSDSSKKINVSESNGKLTFSVGGNSKDTDILSVSSISSDLSQLTGLKSGKSNRLNLNETLENAGIEGLTTLNEDEKYSITINGKTLEFEKTATLNDVIKAINSDSDMKVNISYLSTTNTFSIIADEPGSHIGTKITVDGEGSLSRALFGDGTSTGEGWNIKNGTDTVISYTLNGKLVENVTRSTANFSIDGINIELSKNAVTNEPVTFDVTNNSDEVVERVKQFINDYNEIINLVGTKTKEKPKRSYEPLTPEQEDEMEEKEIENWVKEAKKGVLFGDTKMLSLFNDLRSSLTGKTDVSDLVLANIGISAASMDTSGKLVLDEAKFKEKLLNDPDEIASLFTDTKGGTGDNTKSGLAVQLRDVLRKNIGAYGTSGVLIDEAGLDSGRTSDQNNISLKMKDYDDKMAELKKDLEAERKRYWNQFSALEKALNSLNAQSSWLTDMMG